MFVHTTCFAQTLCQTFTEPSLSSLGLTQCEHCGRRFNDAAYMKHKDQCKVKQTISPPEQTEEQKEAKLRFLMRMKVFIIFNIGILLFANIVGSLIPITFSE